MTDLLSQPLWRAEDLGMPIPESLHATSVCLPTWASNVAYEEGDEEVVNALQAGYPRFIFNRLVEKLMQRETPAGEFGIILGCEASAKRGQAFAAAANVSASIRRLRDDAWLLSAAESAKDRIKAFWQHAGEGISSRVAAELLGEAPIATGGDLAREAIRERVAAALATDEGACRLYPSGMAAIAAAWRVGQAYATVSKTVQFGFPYVDTLKLQEQFGEVLFLSVASEDAYQQVEEACEQGTVGAVFCECPANPLLDCPDLERLSKTCRKNNVLLIVDDTVATSVNVDVTPYADLVTTSLTKAFSGVGDVIAGALTVSPQSPVAAELRRLLAADESPLLPDADAKVLEANSRDYAARVQKMSATSEIVAEFLRNHPAVADVRFPKYTSSELFDECRREAGGYGALISIVLENPEATSARFFDQLEISKGPSLGTNYSLVCPYTLLAHYHELDKVEACGVSRWLIRISIGLEDPQDLINRFTRALSA